MLRNKGMKTSNKKVIDAKLMEKALKLGGIMLVAYAAGHISAKLDSSKLADAMESRADRVKLHHDLETDYGFMMKDNEALETLLENAK